MGGRESQRDTDDVDVSRGESWGFDIGYGYLQLDSSRPTVSILCSGLPDRDNVVT